MAEEKNPADNKMVAGGLCVMAGLFVGLGAGFLYLH